MPESPQCPCQSYSTNARTYVVCPAASLPTYMNSSKHDFLQQQYYDWMSPKLSTIIGWCGDDRDFVCSPSVPRKTQEAASHLSPEKKAVLFGAAAGSEKDSADPADEANRGWRDHRYVRTAYDLVGFARFCCCRRACVYVVDFERQVWCLVPERVRFHGPHICTKGSSARSVQHAFQVSGVRSIRRSWFRSFSPSTA